MSPLATFGDSSKEREGRRTAAGKRKKEEDGLVREVVGFESKAGPSFSFFLFLHPFICLLSFLRWSLLLCLDNQGREGWVVVRNNDASLGGG